MNVQKWANIIWKSIYQHIKLATLITHTWYLNNLPSFISSSLL